MSSAASSADERPSVARRVGGRLQATFEYLRAVRAEVRKITWPSRQELRQTTIVIVIFVIVIGLIIGIMDVISSWLLIGLLGRILQ